jgi:hypothetical protein
VIVSDRDVMGGEIFEARWRANGIEIIVEDGDFHGWGSSGSMFPEPDLDGGGHG